MSKTKWCALGLVAALACGAAVFESTSAFAGDGSQDPNKAARQAAMRERLKQGLQRTREASVRFLSSLQGTDEQRNLVLEKTKAAAPILKDARKQARDIVAQARASASASSKAADGKLDRKAVRASVTAQLKTLRQNTRNQLTPLAKEVVASLTPDQRQKLEDIATKHGKTLGDARLTHFVMALICRPTTAAFLEARQAK